MRVSRVQAEKNRQAVIDVASRLFREHGFDGIGLKGLMEGAGLTQGAFYKQFESKDDLAAQASRQAFESTRPWWTEAAAANPEDPLRAVIALYLSLGHREGKSDGCPLVALGADAARQGPDVKASFEAGIKDRLDMVAPWIGEGDAEAARNKAMVILSTMAGAVMLARAVNDEQLSKQILDAAANGILNGRSSATPSEE